MICDELYNSKENIYSSEMASEHTYVQLTGEIALDKIVTQLKYTNIYNSM